MLKQILNVKNIEVLKKETQKNIQGGVRSICPSEGEYCPDDAASIPVNCITDVAYCCVNNTWTRC